MTREERLKHKAQGKIVLKVRRNPKLNIWEIVYYNGASYNIYSWDSFPTKEDCEAEIERLVKRNTNLFVAEIITEKEGASHENRITNL